MHYTSYYTIHEKSHQTTVVEQRHHSLMLDDRYDYGRDQCDSRDGHNTYNGFLRRIHTLDDFLC